MRVVARVVAAMLGAQAVAAAQCSNPWLSANVVALAGQVLFHQVLAVELTAGLPLLGSNGLSLTLGSF